MKNETREVEVKVKGEDGIYYTIIRIEKYLSGVWVDMGRKDS
jgi:hypothetical protein